MPPRRRGFALPIVILLALVAGILAAVVLERQSYQTRVVSREISSYQDTHFERGVREVVGQWTDSLIGQSIDKLLESDGHALDIERPDGSVVSVYLFDGQGTALSEPTGLNDQDAKDAEGVYEALAGGPRGKHRRHKDVERFVRPVGPVRVFVASAPREVLEAIGTYAKEGKSGRRFADSILDARKQGDVTEADLNTAMSMADITVEGRAVVQRLIVFKPELWDMVVDVYTPGKGGGALDARYGGRFLMPVQGFNAGRSSTMASLGRFLTWEPLPIDEESGN